MNLIRPDLFSLNWAASQDPPFDQIGGLRGDRKGPFQVAWPCIPGWGGRSPRGLGHPQLGRGPERGGAFLQERLGRRLPVPGIILRPLEGAGGSLGFPGRVGSLDDSRLATSSQHPLVPTARVHTQGETRSQGRSCRLKATRRSRARRRTWSPHRPF